MKDISKSKYLEAILVITVGLMVLYYFTGHRYWLISGIGIGVLSLVSSTIARLITYAWYKLAQGLGYINSRIILSILFFVFLVPIALLARIFQKKKDPLQLKKQANESYFVIQNKRFSPSDLENLW